MTTTTKTGDLPAVATAVARSWKSRLVIGASEFNDPATRRQVYKCFVGGSREANQDLANFAADVRARKAKPIRAQNAEAKALLGRPA